MKNMKYYYAAWVVVVAMINIIAFATPSEINGVSKYDGMFWPAYVCIMLSCVVQLACTYYSVNKADSLNKLFLNIPIIAISYVAVLLSGLFGIVSLALPTVPTWIGILIAALMTGLVILAILKAAAASDIIESVDKKVKNQTFFIRNLTADSLTLLNLAKTTSNGEICNKVYESVRYSDPVSNDALLGLESQITIQFNKFSDAVKHDADNATQLGDELLILLDDRNNKCKMLK